MQPTDMVLPTAQLPGGAIGERRNDRRVLFGVCAHDRQHDGSLPATLGPGPAAPCERLWVNASDLTWLAEHRVARRRSTREPLRWKELVGGQIDRRRNHRYVEGAQQSSDRCAIARQRSVEALAQCRILAAHPYGNTVRHLPGPVIRYRFEAQRYRDTPGEISRHG